MATKSKNQQDFETVNQASNTEVKTSHLHVAQVPLDHSSSLSLLSSLTFTYICSYHFLISFEGMSICHFFHLSYFPRGQWIFLSFGFSLTSPSSLLNTPIQYWKKKSAIVCLNTLSIRSNLTVRQNSFWILICFTANLIFARSTVVDASNLLISHFILFVFGCQSLKRGSPYCFCVPITKLTWLDY